ncbi:MAG: hypothetical protein ACFFG0_28830 [Candidatus Thorarchaeota archaeon]
MASLDIEKIVKSRTTTVSYKKDEYDLKLFIDSRESPSEYLKNLAKHDPKYYIFLEENYPTQLDQEIQNLELRLKIAKNPRKCLKKYIESEERVRIPLLLKNPKFNEKMELFHDVQKSEGDDFTKEKQMRWVKDHDVLSKFACSHELFFKVIKEKYKEK